MFLPGAGARSQSIQLYLTHQLLMLSSRSSYSVAQGTTRDSSAEMYEQVLTYSALNKIKVLNPLSLLTSSFSSYYTETFNV